MKQIVMLEKPDIHSLLEGNQIGITVNGQEIFIQSEVIRRHKGKALANVYRGKKQLTPKTSLSLRARKNIRKLNGSFQCRIKKCKRKSPTRASATMHYMRVHSRDARIGRNKT